MARGGFGDFLDDLFSPLGGVTMQRMFGGLAVRHDGLMIGLVIDDVLYLKADEETIPLFQAEGSEPFQYGGKDGRVTTLTYWRAPEQVYDDPDAFLSFAGLAVEAAQRAERKKAAGRNRRPPATD
jgi:DNA transformation protein and related proteins